jgi:uncharacterized phage protein (TIGR01671 family)
MREIKFRAWVCSDYEGNTPTNLKMYYNVQNYYDGNLGDRDEAGPLDGEGLDFDSFGDLLSGPESEERVISIMQFTGLLDKNGEEIYEGDIVKDEFIRGDGSEYKKISVVIFGEYYEDYDEYGLSGYGFYMKEIKKHKEQDATFLEEVSIVNPIGKLSVIGNIHENPELLEVKSEK